MGSHCTNKYWPRTFKLSITFCVNSTKFTPIKKTTKTPWLKFLRNYANLKLTTKTSTMNLGPVTSWSTKNSTPLPTNIPTCSKTWTWSKKCGNKAQLHLNPTSFQEISPSARKIINPTTKTPEEDQGKEKAALGKATGPDRVPEQAFLALTKMAISSTMQLTYTMKQTITRQDTANWYRDVLQKRIQWRDEARTGPTLKESMNRI